MTKLITPIILIGIAISLFFMFTNPFYNEVSVLKAEVASYDEALNNSKALENERDKLTLKYNSIDLNNLMRIEKLMPENVDNIRLILEIEQIAAPYGMFLKDVKYNTTDTNTGAPATGALAQGGLKAQQKDYGIFDLSFSITGNYDNFINFTKDLESNLRIVDIASISFSSDGASALNTKTISPETYKYDFKIKTYWLKN